MTGTLYYVFFSWGCSVITIKLSFLFIEVPADPLMDEPDGKSNKSINNVIDNNISNNNINNDNAIKLIFPLSQIK